MAADQISKYFVVERIAYGSAVPCWRGLYISPMYEITAQRFPSFKVSGGYLLQFS